MDAAEEELRSSLVIFVGGTRSTILSEQVTGHLNRHLGITAEDALIRRYKVSSFLISFIDMRLVDWVLHSPPPVGAELVLVFACYCRQTGALFSPLRFKVLLALENIPVHAWSWETVHAVVNCSCLIFDMAPGLVDGSNLSSYWAAAWCVHPDLIPTEVGCIFPEPEEIIEDRASPPLFIPTSDIIHSKRDTLQHKVLIKIVEVHDFTPLLDFDPDGDGDSSTDDSVSDVLLGPILSSSLRPWPRIFRLTGKSLAADGRWLSLPHQGATSIGPLERRDVGPKTGHHHMAHPELLLQGTFGLFRDESASSPPCGF
jgi:hypothetical protein